MSSLHQVEIRSSIKNGRYKSQATPTLSQHASRGDVLWHRARPPPRAQRTRGRLSQSHLPALGHSGDCLLLHWRLGGPPPRAPSRGLSRQRNSTTRQLYSTARQLLDAPAHAVCLDRLDRSSTGARQARQARPRQRLDSQLDSASTARRRIASTARQPGPLSLSMFNSLSEISVNAKNAQTETWFAMSFNDISTVHVFERLPMKGP
jgi:hypothetical protein